MELGTFGAIVSFAMALEEQAASFYEQETAARPAELFDELARGSRKRLRRLERARREMVAEMILESISGLETENYSPEVNSGGDLLPQARALEEAAARFYRDAADKMPIKEVERLFRRLAKENEKRQARLP